MRLLKFTTNLFRSTLRMLNHIRIRSKILFIKIRDTLENLNKIQDAIIIYDKLISIKPLDFQKILTKNFVSLINKG